MMTLRRRKIKYHHRQQQQLPEELLFEVLVRLPVKSLLRFTCVSKLWYHIIHSQYFVSKHLLLQVQTNNIKVFAEKNYSYFFELDFHNLLKNNDNVVVVYSDKQLKHPLTFDDMRIVGTSNGLVCLIMDYDSRIVFWNPSTNKYRHGPLVNGGECVFNSSSPYKEQYCFGYDHKTHDYKFVMVKYYYYDDDDNASFHNIVVIKVYSLKSNSWGPPREKYGLYLQGQQSVFANGAIYCLAQKEKKGDYYLFAFDLATEEWGVVAHVMNYMNFGLCPYRLGTTLDGSLYIRGDSLGLTRFDVWVMINTEGINKSWNKLFSISGIDVKNHGYVEVVACAESERQVLILQSKKFKLYDIEEKTFRDVVVPGESVIYEVFTCIETLVRV